VFPPLELAGIFAPLLPIQFADSWPRDHVYDCAPGEQMDIKGKKVVLTGTFASFGRDEATKKLTALGALVVGSLSKNTDVLFAGDKAGSKKTKAESLGVPVLSEKELLAILASESSGAVETTAPATVAPKTDAQPFLHALELQIREKGRLRDEARPLTIDLSAAPESVRNLAEALATYDFYIHLGKFGLGSTAVRTLEKTIKASVDSLQLDVPDIFFGSFIPAQTLDLPHDGGPGTPALGVSWLDGVVSIFTVEVENPTDFNLVTHYFTAIEILKFLRAGLVADSDKANVGVQGVFDTDDLADIADRLSPGGGYRSPPTPAAPAASAPKLAAIMGQKVVLTGTFASFSRDEATKKLTAIGAVVVGSISKNTDVLFAGDKAGSKRSKAESLGVKVLGEQDLIDILRSGENPSENENEPEAGKPVPAGMIAFVMALDAQIRETGRLRPEAQPIEVNLDDAPESVRALAEALSTYSYNVDLGEFDLWPGSSVRTLEETIEFSADMFDDVEAVLNGLDPSRTITLGADGGGMSELGISWSGNLVTAVIVEIDDPAEDNFVTHYDQDFKLFSFLRDRLDDDDLDSDEGPFDPPGLADISDRISPGSAYRYVAPPTADSVRFTTYFADPAVTEKLRKKAVSAAKKGEVGFAPIVGWTPSPSNATPPEPLRWAGAKFDVLFVPHHDGRERVLITAPGESSGQELDLPSLRSYRNLAALSPDGQKLAVGSPVCTRTVELASGDQRVLLQGPQQIAVVWLDNNSVAVMTQEGAHQLDGNDPDVADLPSVKKLGIGAKIPPMRTPGGIYVLNVDARKVVASLQIKAEAMERVPGHSALVIRREPPKNKSWGTLVLRIDNHLVTSVAKFPCDIGAISLEDDTLRSANGFEILGLAAALKATEVAGHRSFLDTMKLEPQPLPPQETARLSSVISMNLTDDWGTPIPESIAARFDWVEPVAEHGIAVATRKRDGAHDVALVNLKDGSEITVAPPVSVDVLESAWAWDGSRVLLWSGQTVYEILASGASKRFAMLPGPVLAAAAVRDGGTAILHRCADVDAELDIISASGALTAYTHVFPHDYLWSLNRGTMLLLGPAYPDPDSAKVRTLAVAPDGLRIHHSSEVRVAVSNVLNIGDTSLVELSSGARYRLDVDSIPEVDLVSDPVRKLDQRASGDTFHGYIDRKGEWTSPPIWVGGDKWQGGRGRVKWASRFALLSSDGDLLTSPVFKKIEPFMDGVAGVTAASGRLGAIDPDGSWVLEPKYDYVGAVSGERIRTGLDAVYALRTLDGELVADGFSKLYMFLEGLAFAEKDGKAGFIKPDGTWAFQGAFTDTSGFLGGIAAVKFEDTTWGLVRTDGTPVGGIYEDLIGARLDNDKFIAAVRRDKDWGYINGEGQVVINYQFKVAYAFKNGLGPVQFHSGAAGYVTADGLVMQGDGWGVYRVDCLAWFRKNSRMGVVGVDGTIIHDAVFDAAGVYSEGLTPVRKNLKWGLMDKNAEFQIEPIYEDILAPSDGLIPFQMDRKWGYMDLNGNVVIEPRFRWVNAFSEGHAAVPVV